MKVAHVEQYSPLWWKVRRGIPTASEFGRIVSPAKGIYAEGAVTYMDELIASAVGQQSSFKGTEDTDRGNLLEKPALRWLAYQHGIQTEEVGFLLSDDETHGASPDSMVAGQIVPVEIKAPKLSTLLGWRREYKKTKTVPREHRLQVHGEMFVSGADCAIFVGYAEYPCVENLLIEVKRDDFTEKLGDHLARFTKELREAEEDTFGEHLAEYRDGLAKGRAEALATGRAAA